MRKTKILLVDDDIELCELLESYLSQEGFDVAVVHNGQDAIHYCQSKDVDLVILDIMMPIKNGFDALREIRLQDSLPILMLTAKGDKIDRIVGLEMGADDYLAKPCDPRELTARIRAILRRTVEGSIKSNAQHIIVLDDVILDSNSRSVSVKGLSIDLTSTEFDLLKLLMENFGKFVTREQISNQVLGKKLQSFDRSIDMHISHLRKKLGVNIDNSERIKTVRGNGYQFTNKASSSRNGSR